MRRNLGLVSFLGGVLSWCTLMLAFVFGGLDPSPTQTPLLQAVSMGALVTAAMSSCLGVVALARGPKHLAALLGLITSLLFLLYFTGLGFASRVARGLSLESPNP
jgi:hypothetical protein